MGALHHSGPLYVGGTRAVQTATVALTNAQIKALRATPKLLVAAQGADTVIEFLGAVLKLVAGTNVLTETADNMVVRHTGTTGSIVSDTIEATGFIDQAVNTQTTAVPIKDNILASSTTENAGLYLHNTGDGEYAGNAALNATMKVFITYRVITV